VTINDVKYHLHNGHGSAHGNIVDRLGFHKVCARWVPKQLTEEHMHNYLTICQGLVNHYCNESGAFLRYIVTEDETWIHH
jgi:hypothetical protein